MVTNQKPTGRATTMPIGIAIGILVSTALTLILSGVLAWLVLGEKVSDKSMGYGIILILLLASVAGATLSIKTVKHRKMFAGMATGIGYLSVLLMCTALFFGGQYQGVGVTAAVVLSGSLATGLISARERKSGKKRTKKFRSR